MVGRLYSEDFRRRVLEEVAEGNSRRSAARRFKVGASSAIRWKRRLDATGSAAPAPRAGKSRSPLEAHAPWLAMLIAAEPDLSLAELTQRVQAELGGPPGSRRRTQDRRTARSQTRLPASARPSNPSSANRSCQRQTQVFDVPVRRMISFVPTPSAVKSTIWPRHTCFCGALRSLIKAKSRSRSFAETVNDIPVRIHQTRILRVRRESVIGFKCQI